MRKRLFLLVGLLAVALLGGYLLLGAADSMSPVRWIHKGMLFTEAEAILGDPVSKSYSGSGFFTDPPDYAVWKKDGEEIVLGFDTEGRVKERHVRRGVEDFQAVEDGLLDCLRRWLGIR
jgi:hypothetical protein